MSKTPFPLIPKALMEHLQDIFPNRLPTNKNITLTDLNYSQGERAVVDLLQRHFDAQQANILKQTHVPPISS